MLHVECAVLVADLVDSVALMIRDEASVIGRWRDFHERVASQLLPSGSRIVKSLGDGMLIVADDARAAAALAFDMHEAIERGNAGSTGAIRMQLRIGANHTSLVSDGIDVYGIGVNLAARLAALAGPGETVAAAAFRDRLTSGVDTEIDDLGDHYLKNIEAPVRAFRLRRCGTRGDDAAVAWIPEPAAGAEMPALAVLTFPTRGADASWAAAGELLADDLSAALARSRAWRVSSRLSSGALTGTGLVTADAAQRLGARYLISGSVTLIAGSARIHVELSDAARGDLLWADSVTASPADVVAGGEVVMRMAQSIGRALLERELALVRGRPLSALHERVLLLQAVASMHRMSNPDSDRALAALELVTARHPRHAVGHAWRAKWHLIRIAQAWSRNPQEDATGWRQSTHRALDQEPDHPLALALDGHALTLLSRDLAGASRRMDAALASDPNEPLAWLFRSAVLAYQGDGAGATESIERALLLSPLDPMRYFYEAFAALAALSDGRPADALAAAQRSVRLNRQHLSSWIMLAIAAVECDRLDEAAAAGQQILRQRPDAKVSRFLAAHPAADSARGRHDSDALRLAGIPD